MKKVTTLLIFLLLTATVQAYDSCTSLGGMVCSSDEFCSGDEVLAYDRNDVLSNCCLGECKVFVSTKCENISKIDIKGYITCKLSTLKEKISSFNRVSSKLMINLMSIKVPAKPYPKLYDFWLKLAETLGVAVIIFTVINYLKLLSDNTTPPEKIYNAKKRLFLFLMGGLILLFLPLITTLLFTIMDMGITAIVNIFVPNGDFLALMSSITQRVLGFSSLYLVRDILYFFFLLLLLWRYLIIYILLVFAPIMVLFYLFFITQEIGKWWLRSLLKNIFIPWLWVLVFTILSLVAFTTIDTLIGTYTLLPLLLSAVIFINIYLYKYLAHVSIGVGSLLKKIFKFVIRKKLI